MKILCHETEGAYLATTVCSISAYVQLAEPSLSQNKQWLKIWPFFFLLHSSHLPHFFGQMKHQSEVAKLISLSYTSIRQTIPCSCVQRVFFFVDVGNKASPCSTTFVPSAQIPTTHNDPTNTRQHTDSKKFLCFPKCYQPSAWPL